MSPYRVVVVGASLAGLRTVEALRSDGCDARITLIGDEPELPYDRPPLSKDLLLGKTDLHGVRLASDESLAALDIDLRLATKAIGLAPAERRVTVTDGFVDYDDVVIATGSCARRLPLPELAGVHVLRTAEDAVAIREAMAAGPRVAVVGGGFIGAEVASAARALGLEVTIIDPLPVLMQRGLGDVVGRRMSELHRAAGVRLRLGVQVAGLVGGRAVEGVRLADGTLLAAELVVVGVGAAPNTGWLRGSGLRMSDGVECDQYLRAAPGVYVAGDVARWYHPLYGEHIRTEHWTSAVEHASTIAATLTGQRTACGGLPYVWSDQYGRKLQIAGRVHPGDEVRFLIDEPGRFLAVSGSNGLQHAVLGVGAPGPFVRQQLRLASKPPWPPADAPTSASRLATDEPSAGSLAGPSAMPLRGRRSAASRSSALA